MTAAVTFLKVEGFRVIDEVVALMDPRNPVTASRDLPATITGLAGKLAETMKEPPWREVTGSSGAVYPVYISDTEPYVVYAAMNRAAKPNVYEPHMFVMHVGLRNGLRSAMFFREVSREIDRRIALKGWLP